MENICIHPHMWLSLENLLEKRQDLNFLRTLIRMHLSNKSCFSYNFVPSAHTSIFLASAMQSFQALLFNLQIQKTFKYKLSSLHAKSFYDWYQCCNNEIQRWSLIQHTPWFNQCSLFYISCSLLAILGAITQNGFLAYLGLLPRLICLADLANPRTNSTWF